MAIQGKGVVDALRGLFDAGDWISMKPALDPNAALLSLDHKPDPSEIKLRIGLGLVVVAVCTTIFYVIDDEVGILIAFGFGSFGLLNLVLGVIKSRFEKSMLFTGNDVLVKTRGLLGRKEWREPIANFNGVVLREHHIGNRGVGTITTTKTYHVIELVHRSADKTLPLYVSDGGKSPRRIQEAFARRFKLPALAPDSGGMAARAVDALDVPLAGQPADDPGPPPSGVKVLSRDGAVRITVGQGRIGRVFVWLFWLSIPVIFGGIGYMVDPTFGLAAGGMATFFVVMMLGLAALMGRKTDKLQSALVIEPEQIWIDRPRPDDWMTRLGRRVMSSISGRDISAVERSPDILPRRAIEQIRVDTYTSHYSGSSRGSSHGGSTVHGRLVIEGDDGRLNFVGSQFDKRKLEWVRDYLRHELAGGP